MIRLDYTAKITRYHLTIISMICFDLEFILYKKGCIFFKLNSHKQQFEKEFFFYWKSKFTCTTDSKFARRNL